MQRFSPFVKTARGGSYLPDTEVIRSFIASSRALMTRMTRIAKNGACCLLHKKREAPLINGYNDTFTDSTDGSAPGMLADQRHFAHDSARRHALEIVIANGFTTYM